IMNYGGENLMGATGGFDGDYDDVLIRSHSRFAGYEQIAAPSYPTIAGDTSDQTKVSYFSPRFSGFQVGASITPTPNNGDNFKSDGGWENHIGIGANYDNSFGDLRVRASAVYSGASSNHTKVEDVSAWSVGGIVGWGPFSLGANYTDNAESGSVKTTVEGFASESSYWDVAASFETGPLYFSAGYLASTREFNGPNPLANPEDWGDSTFETISLTVDYTVAPGLGVYAEVDLISDEYYGGTCTEDGINQCANDATIFIAGANVSF
ncbi:MAG: porin, partial [Proteobacteria bacterium]|nr:porin [Pseudomonadota bacterium]